ncbi:ABC-type transport system, involved in lipoprotein release, permease component [Methanocella conradii HZ254]|uniref:ABC-type transport system, involved in lipoprotein release, permease component n=1 Tax=Methanocella conradii (strain DSM 24694 / JCM 17849 / CGMCC 1.5162 / HZ254) TaxID=1041930 RepID=H8I8W3_METCZ|nr:ABC transporter permease [Methanocella conradii]AFD00434.1 ABC-type transport system, involved in lipoprotein release, permease component [Methanocella conradii HZ254]
MIGKYFDFLRIALRQLRAKKFRVILTALGIAVGVAAVIGILAIGEGIRTQAIETIKAQSDLTLIEVTPDVRNETTQLITDARVESIRGIPHVVAAAPAIRDSYATKRQTYLSVLAVRQQDLDKVIKPEYLRGTGFDPGSSDVIFGYNIRETLQRADGIRVGDTFTALVREYNETGVPVDKTFNLTAAGVMRERDDQFDQVVLIDIDTERSIRGSDTDYNCIFVRIDDPNAVFSVVQQIEARGLTAKGAFEQIEAVNRFMDMMVMIFTIFAGFALIVGCLMIMTTMVTSVFERTREIGITMAVGASEGDVISQVMLECLVIGVMGGIAGDVFGLLFSAFANAVGKPFIISQLGTEFSGIFGSQIAIVTPTMLVSGMLIAIVFSLIAGIYPAVKAARLNPVEAIRGI